MSLSDDTDKRLTRHNEFSIALLLVVGVPVLIGLLGLL